MAAINWAAVLAFAPELVTVSGGAQTDILGLVNESIDPDMLDGEDGRKTKMARVLLAAHLGAGVAKSGGSTGVGNVVSESAGGLARAYGATFTLDTASLGTTSYGQAYLAMVRASAAAAPFVP